MNIIKTISAFLLATLVLLYSTGFTLNKMLCLKSGKSKTSFTWVDDCCSKEGAADEVPVLKTMCCDNTSAFFHLNEYNPSQQNEIPAVANCLLPYSYDLISVVAINSHTPHIFPDAPSPYQGKQLLSFISVLLI